jgi:hypothetical protein
MFEEEADGEDESLTEMTSEVLRFTATILLSSALLASVTTTGVTSDATSKAEAVEIRHTRSLSVSRQAAWKLNKTMPRRTSARLLAGSDARYRGYRPFPLILGISF